MKNTSMFQILVRNIISNWIGYASQLCVVFFLTPFIVSALGDTRYGIWSLVTGLTGYYGLLDLGFRAGITQYLTRHLTTKEFEKLNRSASTAFVALASCGAFIFLLSLTLSWLSPLIFNIPEDAVEEARLCICIIGTSTAIQFACFPFSAVFAATQRYDISNLIGISVRLATAGMIFAALKLGYGLLGLSAVNAVGEMLGYGLLWRVAYRILPQLQVSPRLAAKESLGALTTFGLWSFVIQGAVQLRSYSSSVIIGIFLPMTALTPFNLAASLVRYLDQLFAPLAIVFFPMATQFDAKGDFSSLRRLYLAGSKMLVLLGFTAGLVGVIWARDFYVLWVGPRFVEQGEYPPVSVLFALLAVGAVAAIGQKIGIQVFLGARWLKQLGFLVLCEALFNVFLSISLVRPVGLLGVALASSIPAILFQGVIQPLSLCHLLGITRRVYVREVYARPFIVAIVLSTTFVLLRRLIPAANWGTLLLIGLLAGSIALPVLVVLGLNDHERTEFVMQPLSNMWARLSPGRSA